MTPDPILTLSAVCAALSLAGLYLAARLRAAERRADIHDSEIRQLWQERQRLIGALCDVGADLTQIAVNTTRLRDDLTDLRAEHLAQARALDAHDDRLIRLEETPS